MRRSSLMLCAPCYDSLHLGVLRYGSILLHLAAVLMDLRLACCIASLPFLTPSEPATVRATEGVRWHLCCMMTTCMLQLQQVAHKLTPLPYVESESNRLCTYTANFSELPPIAKMSLLSPGLCRCSSVSTRQLEHVDLCKGPMVAALSTLSVEVHAGVVAAADKFFLELRRRYISKTL